MTWRERLARWIAPKAEIEAVVAIEHLPSETPEQRERRRRRAEALLQDEMLAEVLDAMKATAVAAWTRATTTAEREQAWHQAKAAEIFRAELQRVINTARTS